MSLRPLMPTFIAALLLAMPGCSHKIDEAVAPPSSPAVSVTVTRLLERTSDHSTYLVGWRAQEAGAPVDHYLVALDPGSGDDPTDWTRTSDTSRPVTLSRVGAAATERHRFVVIAVDAHGVRSAPAELNLAADNLPPYVRILCPQPTLSAFVPSAFTVTYQGVDADGSPPVPVAYKYLLLSPSSVGPDGEDVYPLSISNPDSVLRLYEAHDWEGWTTVSGETTSVSFSNLVVNVSYSFCIIAIDQAGATTPHWDYTANALRITVASATVLGPRLHVTTMSMQYDYPGAAHENAPGPTAQVPAGVAVPVTWYAEQVPSDCGLRYRWVLDPVDLEDFTPRSDESTDVHRWSAWGDVTNAGVGPFAVATPPKRETHRLYIEADDHITRSRACVGLVVVPRQFTKDVLVVDDTRLLGDMASNGVVAPPTGAWPTRAELDTFLFARGGVPWRAYPAGTLSPQGVLNGYSFDTLGTRGLGVGLVPLSTLTSYRHVIWIVDGPSAFFTKTYKDKVAPITALRLMGAPGFTNPLATYIQLGGHLWLVGGGAGAAVSFPFNDPNNDHPTTTWSFYTSPRNELGPGRFMWDVAKWRNSFRVLKPEPRIRRATGRFTGTAEYAGLPQELAAKTPATDPLSIEAPTRTASNLYQTSANLEFMFADLSDSSNDVLEGGVSALDTLMRASAPTLLDPNEGDPEYVQRHPAYVVMTYAHGPSLGGGTMVHTGVPIWWAQRAQCTQLVDFVLRDLWGLNRRAAPVAVGSADTRIAPPAPMRQPIGRARVAAGRSTR